MRKIVLVVAGLVLLGWCGDQSSEETADSPREASVPAAPSAPTTAPTPTPDAEPQAAQNRQQRGNRRDAEPKSTSTRQRPAEDVSAATDAQPRRQTGTLHRVIDVVDGDTVTVAYRGSEVSVRLIGIDTPETVHPSVPVECGGPQASATAKRLLTGKKVRLVFDPSQGRTDYYGRTLAYLEAPGLGDFGLAMIRQGRAAEYTYDTAYARQSRYRAAHHQAQLHARGVWDRCGGVDTALHTPAPDPKPQAHRSRGSGADSCDPGYDPCIPPSPPDLDCSDVDGPIRVLGDDPHGFDADGDGIGCDS